VRKSRTNPNGIAFVGKPILKLRPNPGVTGPQPMFKVVRSKARKSDPLLSAALNRQDPLANEAVGNEPNGSAHARSISSS
jgi:hypothetical protein